MPLSTEDIYENVIYSKISTKRTSGNCKTAITTRHSYSHRGRMILAKIAPNLIQELSHGPILKLVLLSENVQ